MILEVSKEFERNIRKVQDKKLALSIQKIIQRLSDSNSLNDISGIKKIKASGNFFRIRIGDYRLGLKLFDSKIYRLCFMHRKDIYKYFPDNF